LPQVYGRADALPRGRAKLDDLISRGVPVSPTAWRPLLHLAASRADVATTVSLLSEMRARTGKDVFDTVQLKPCFADNYLLLATGLASGFEATMALLETARAAGRTDALTYNFLIEVALGPERGTRNIAPARLRNANRAWELMEEAGVRPSLALSHRMFGIWAQSGELERAEAAFGAMREASSELLRASASLADAWESAADGGGDLETVARSLAGNPMLALGHSFISYVKMVQACIDAAAPPDKVTFYLETLRQEASERAVPVPWPISEDLLRTLAGSPPARHRQGRSSERAPPPVDLALLDLARAFQLSLAEGGASPPPAGSVTVVSALLDAGQLEAAATALCAAGDPSPRARDAAGWTPPAASWPFVVLQQKYRVMLEQAAEMEDGEAKQRVAALLQRASGVFAEEEPERVPVRVVAYAPPQEPQQPSDEAPPAHTAAAAPPPPIANVPLPPATATVAVVPLPPPPPPVAAATPSPPADAEATAPVPTAADKPLATTTVAVVPPPPPPVAAATLPPPAAMEATAPVLSAADAVDSAGRVEPAPPVEASFEAAPAEAPPAAQDSFAAAVAASRLPEPMPEPSAAEPASASELELRLSAAEAEDDFEQAADIQAEIERMDLAHADAAAAEAAVQAASPATAPSAENVSLSVEPEHERVQGEGQAELQAGDVTGPGVEAPVASAALGALQRRLAVAEEGDDFESAMELQKEIDQLEA